MPKYQDPNFDKEKYWLARKASPMDRRAQRLGKKLANIVAVHSEPDWERKRPTTKAVKKNTKRARKWLTYAS